MLRPSSLAKRQSHKNKRGGSIATPSMIRKTIRLVTATMIRRLDFPFAPALVQGKCLD